MTVARGWKVLFVASIAVFLVAMDVTIVNIAFPQILADFDTDRAGLSWVLSGYNIAFAACLLTSGRLADRFGRRRVFFIGIWIFTAASALCGLAPNAEMLVAARILQAMGGALIMPASLALVLPEFPVERRSAAIGVWGAVGGLSAAAGPVIGGSLIDIIEWRGLFFINAPACLAAYLFGRRLLVESRDPNATGLPDIGGAVLATAGVALFVLGIVEGDRWGWGSARIVGAFAAGVLLLLAFTIRCGRIDDPVLDLDLFRARFFSVGNATSLVFSAGFFAMIFVNVQFLTGVWGYDATGTGLAIAPGPLMAALVAAPAGRLADRLGHRIVIVPGTILFAAGVAAAALWLPSEPAYWSRYFPMFLVTGFGVGLTISTSNAASNAFLPPDRFAMGGALNSTVRQVGAALGIAIVVAVLGDGTATGSFDDAFTFVAVAGLLAGLLMWALYRPPIAPAVRPVSEGPVAAVS
ncbi:MAG TPA: DHA2 family efflux MFS transporter permease subunit [Acidimicrobiales bacterium]|nr:DHA2 family efflux MFS transporter permease subunit [Acidimicrobiales bacterium]